MSSNLSSECLGSSQEAGHVILDVASEMADPELSAFGLITFLLIQKALRRFEVRLKYFSQVRLVASTHNPNLLIKHEH